MLRLLLPLLLVAAPLFAQPANRANCHGVVQATLASGNEHPHLQPCAPHIVPELAAVIRGASTRRDVRTLALLHRLSFFIRDPALFDAGLQLAQSGGADPAARVLGFSVALTQLDPVLSFQGAGAERPFQAPLSENCAEASFLVFDAHYWADNGLSDAALPRLRSLAQSLSESTPSPLMVRRFARCVALILPDEDEPSKAIPDWTDGE